MRIDENRFLSAQIGAEAMGVPADQSEKILKDLKTGAGEKVNFEVARALLMVLAGKELNGNAEYKLLDAIRSLHEYGARTATGDIKEGALSDWTEDQKNVTKLLVATLEGWFYGEHPINIRAEHFSLITFLVNRLAKIAESQTKDQSGKLLIPDYDPVKLKGFTDDVQKFAGGNLKPEVIEQELSDTRQQIQEKNNEKINLQSRIKEKTSQANKTNEESKTYIKQKKKTAEANKEYDDYLDNNRDKMIGELLETFGITIDKLRYYRSSLLRSAGNESHKSPHEKDPSLFQHAGVLIDFLIKHKNQLAEKMIDQSVWQRNTQSFDLKSSIGEVAERMRWDDENIYEAVAESLRRIQEDLRKKSKDNPPAIATTNPKKMETAPVAPLRTKGFAGLAALKKELPAPPNPKDKSLQELLFSDLACAGPMFDVLIKKYHDAKIEQGHLVKITVEPDTKAEQEAISQIESDLQRLPYRINELNTLKKASLDAFTASQAEITRDLSRSGAGLYLLKSIIIALKMVMDKSHAKKTTEASPYAAMCLALDKTTKNTGPAKVFELTGANIIYDEYYYKAAGHEVVHYLPQHMPFAHMAAALLLKRQAG